VRWTRGDLFFVSDLFQKPQGLGQRTIDRIDEPCGGCRIFDPSRGQVEARGGVQPLTVGVRVGPSDDEESSIPIQFVVACGDGGSYAREGASAL